MKDRWGINHLGVRALSQGTRIVKLNTVSIGGERFGSTSDNLVPYEGKEVFCVCCCVYGLEYDLHDIESCEYICTVKPAK